MKNTKLLLIAFALSNFSALVYEIAWSKELVYVFGTSIYAVSTILTCFMAGMAIGSYWIGRKVDTSRNLIRLFALLEVGIGIYGILTLWLFEVLVHPYNLLYDVFHETFILPFSQFVLAFFTLVLPTAFIGATFPVMSKIYANENDVLGKNIGIIYALDTAGASAGSIAAGFMLIPLFGIDKSIAIASIVNLAVGLALYNLKGDAVIKIRKIQKPPKDSLEKAIIVGFFLSGFAALSYEVVWIRSISLIFGSTTFGLSAILSAFLLGLALGSYIVCRIVDRTRDLLALFVFVELGIAFFGISSILFFPALDTLYFMIYSKFHTSFTLIWTISFFIFFSLMLIPTSLMGATLPIVGKIYSREIGCIGRDIGLLFSSNTVGGILGSFFTGFIFIPIIGFEKATIVAALVNIVVAFLVSIIGRLRIEKKLVFHTVGVLLAITGIFGGFALNPLDAGLYHHIGAIDDFDEYLENRENVELLFKKDDPNGLVTVTKWNDIISLRINGKADASNAGDIPTEYMLAFIPLAAHENPESVLNIGLGGGFTLSVIEDFKVNDIDVVEINSGVVEATEKFFNFYNEYAMDDPRVNVIIADARNYLLTHEKKYDVIISEPSNTWLQGESVLFTKEFYEIVDERLNEGGVFCQWVPEYDHRPEDLKILLNTFQLVFPYVHVYEVDNDMIFVGSNERMFFSYPRLESIFNSRGIKEHFEALKYSRYLSFGIKNELSDIEYFLSFFLMDEQEIPDYIDGTDTINTDDLPILEFNTLRNSMVGVQELPYSDIFHYKIKNAGQFSRKPPLENMVSESGKGHEIDLLRVSIDDATGWKLVDVQYGYVYFDYLIFNIIRQASYETPHGDLLLSVEDNFFDEPKENEITGFLSSNWKLDGLRKIEEINISDHKGYLLAGDGYIVAAWYCKENAALYIALMPYTNDHEIAKETFRQIRCMN